MSKITQTELNHIMDEGATFLLLNTELTNIKTLDEVTKVKMEVKGQNIIIQGDKEILGIRRIVHQLTYAEQDRTCRIEREGRNIKIYIKREEIKRFELITLIELTYLDIKQQY